MGVLGPVVAGSFYPEDPWSLRTGIDWLLSEAPPLEVPQPKALIMPHAGYRFSGGVAAAAVAALKPGYKRVVVLGPSHHHRFDGIALPDAEAIATPLGNVPIDRKIVGALAQLDDINIVPEAFAKEHSIEVELPFLQQRLETFDLVPLIVGNIGHGALVQIVDTLFGAEDTLLVISTDLTHFLTSEEASKIDLETATAIEKADPKGLTGKMACGARPLAAFLTVAAQRGLNISRLALTNSGLVTGETERVVGYGAWMAHEPEADRLGKEHRKTALRVASRALQSRARRGANPAIALRSFPVPLQGSGATFVTVTLDGKLRGCIGSLAAHRPIAEDIIANACRAAFEDPRFTPMNEGEVARAELEIALLSRARPIAFDGPDDLKAQLRPGRDGLILRAGDHRSTFLPKVWETLETPDAFLNALKTKAGLDREAWPADLRVWRYTAESFSGPVSLPN